MSEQNLLQNGLAGMYGYMGLVYGDYVSFESALLNEIDNLEGVDQATKDEASSAIQSSQPLSGMLGPDLQSAITEALISAPIAGSAAYLIELSYFYGQVGAEIATNAIPGQSFGAALE